MTDQSVRYIPALGSITDGLEPYALPMLRFVTGAILVPHGCQKLFGWFAGAGFEKFSEIFGNIGYKPGWFWALVVGLTELVGGACLALGLFTRVAAAFIVIFMINAVWFTSSTKGFFWTAGGSEFSLLIGFAALTFLLRGGGKCSIDRSLGREF
ncbi:MAG: DoxX family protein [Rhizomicrobium sp.]